MVPRVSGLLNASQVRARRHSPVATLSMSDIRPTRRGTGDTEVGNVATNVRSSSTSRFYFYFYDAEYVCTPRAMLLKTLGTRLRQVVRLSDPQRTTLLSSTRGCFVNDTPVINCTPGFHYIIVCCECVPCDEDLR